MAPPSGTTATTAGPAPAPLSPRDMRGGTLRRARSGGWQRQRCRSSRHLGSPGQPPPTPGCRPRGLRQPRSPPPPPRQQALPTRPRREPKAHRGLRLQPQQAAPRPRPRPLARRQRGGGLRCRPQAPRRGLLRPQRGEGRVHKELRPRPRRAAPPPRPATPRAPARRGRGGWTPHGPRAPRREPPQLQRVTGRARSSPPTPTPATPTPAPPSRSPPRPPSPQGRRSTSAPRRPSVRRWASRCRSCRGSRTPGA